MGTRLLTLWSLLCLLAPSAVAGDVFFGDAGVSIAQPDGFQVAGDWDGFGQRSTGASILVMTVEAPYEALAAGFTAANLSAKGWTLLSRETVDLDGRPGVLIHFSQPAQGQTYLKWSVIFGSPTHATMVTGTFPEAHAATLSAPLKSAVLSARPATSGAGPEAPGLGLAVTPGPALVASDATSGALLYTKDGVVPAATPSDPLFIVAPSVGSAAIGDPKAFAEQRLYQTAHTEVEAIRWVKPIRVDGLDGFETLATAYDEASRTPILLYQVLLVDGQAYVLIQGLVGRELESTYLPVFQAAARSLVRTD